MLTFQHIYQTASANERSAFELLEHEIEHGRHHQGSTLLMLLSMYPQFKIAAYSIEVDKLKNAQFVLDFLSEKYGERTQYQVPFAYWLIKNNQQGVLVNLVDKPNANDVIYSPFQSFFNENKEMVFTYNHKYNGEKLTKENVKNYHENRTQLEIEDNKLLRWQLSFLPKIVSPMPQSLLISQLKPFYKLDQSVQKFTETLMANRKIDIVHGQFGILAAKARIADHEVKLEKGLDYNDPSWELKLAERNDATASGVGMW